MAQRLALREPAGLGFDLMMGCQGGYKLGVQARPLIPQQLRRPVQVCLGGPRQGQHLLSHLQQLPLGLAHQHDKHLAHPPALAAEAAHHLLKGTLELLRFLSRHGALGDALGHYGADELGTFWGLIRVAAFIDAWLPAHWDRCPHWLCVEFLRRRRRQQASGAWPGQLGPSPWGVRGWRGRGLGTSGEWREGRGCRGTASGSGTAGMSRVRG